MTTKGAVEVQGLEPRSSEGKLEVCQSPLSLRKDDKQQQNIKEAFYHFAFPRIPNTDYYLCQSFYNDQWI